MANNARLIDPALYLSAGIKPPKKGCPPQAPGFDRKAEIKKQLRILDEQDAVNRYRWFNLPCNLSSQELERLIYYKGQLCFFYMPTLGQFFFTPYALAGTIDFYGRYNTVQPVPYAGGTDEQNQTNKNTTSQMTLLSSLKLDVLYGVPSEENRAEWVQKFINGTACILVHDYSKQTAQTIIARQILQEPLLDIMADCIPFMRTSLLANCGIKGMRITNESDEPNVLDANAALERAALNGEIYIPMVGQVNYQELTGNAALKAEEFLLAMQGLDNYRLSLYGLDNGGLFQKRSHMLEAEQSMNAGKAAIPYQDGLSIRQYFCDIVNSITGLGISCEPSEAVLANDMNLDGEAVDEQDQSGITEGEQPQVTEEV
jgi:hypothetical protein